MNKYNLIRFFRIFQLLLLIPPGILYYLGGKKMGVMRYAYFINREISKNLLTEKSIKFILIIVILSIIIFMVKTFKYKEKKYFYAIGISVFMLLLIKFNLFPSEMIHHVILLFSLFIFGIELIILKLKK